MSVINKMLKDLDERAPEADMTNAQAPSSVYIEKSPKSVNKALLGLLAIIAIALIFIAGNMYLTSKTQPTVEVAKPNLPANETNELQTAKTTPAKPSRHNDAEKVATAATENIVESMTTNNAESTSKQTPNTSQLPSSDDAPTVNNLGSAKPLQTIDNNSQLVATAAKPESSVQRPVVKKTPNPAKMVEAKSEPAQVETAQPQPTAAVPKLVIEKSSSRLTPEQRIEKLVGEAQTAFDKGYITEGVEKLNQVLSIADGHVEARNMLAAAWYGRGELNKAVGILNDGLQRYPQIEQWRLTAAKIFFKENNPVGAFSYLETDLSNGSREFYSMKGSLASQLKRHDKAESAYMQLTQIDPDAGNWWLGLAVAQDSQGKQVEAKDSYKNVLSRGGVSQSSLNFVRQRLTELEG